MSLKTDVRLDTLAYVIVHVRDTEQALLFYRDILGMKVLLNDSGWVELSTGATTLALHNQATTDKSSSAVIPVFQVKDIESTYQSLNKAGVKFISTPKQVCEVGPNQVGLSADFHDPDGNLLSIYGIVNK